MTAERFATTDDGVQLCFDTFGLHGDRAPILLIMGLGSQMVAWHEDFCAHLAAEGHPVVRFDNRDTGRSTRFTQKLPPVWTQIARRVVGREVHVAYTLRDMACDALTVLDELGFDEAHVVGASMGGMIAQVLAIHHADRLKTMTSIMSTPGSPWAGMPTPRALKVLLQRPANPSREAYADHLSDVFEVLGAGDPPDPEHLRQYAYRCFDRGPSGDGFERQLAAVLHAPDRRKALGGVRVPTLVLHGALDPLVPVRAGRQTAACIPDARLIEVPKMGHAMSGRSMPVLASSILEHARRC